jgi:hypothetical protein
MPISPVLPPQAPGVEQAKTGVIDGAREVERLQVDPVVASEIVKDQKVALVVAGVSYPRPAQGNKLDPKKHRSFHKLALNYTRYLLTNGVVDRVVLLDFQVGHFRTFVKGGAKDGAHTQPLRDPILVKNYRYNDNGTLTHKAPSKDARQLYYTGAHEFALQEAGDEDADIDKQAYDPWSGAKENSMSVSDLYELVRFGFAGTIKEVHCVGHGWMGGPIIVNTLDYHSKQYDKDGRTDDFTHQALSHVFDAQNAPVFRANLTSEAFFTLWGCENNQRARELILKAKAKEAGKRSFQVELYKLRSIVKGTYAAKLAKVSQRTVYAALPGTYAVAEGEPNDDASGFSFTPTVMHVNLEKCLHILQFYKKHLGSDFPTTGVFRGHPTFGRGYAKFLP